MNFAERATVDAIDCSDPISLVFSMLLVEQKREVIHNSIV